MTQRAETGGAGSSRAGTWTTRALLDWMSGAFREAGLESPRLCAEMLVSHALGCDRVRLYTEQDRPASEGERDRLRALTARALKHEPVQYLVEEAWFFSLPLHVDRRVLIPRPCTELIVEEVVQAARGRDASAPPLRMLDLGTGSGCIAIALARNITDATIVATDVSADALEVAQGNAERHGVSDRITFLAGDLFEPVEAHGAGPFDVIATNPPYIPDEEWESPGMVGENVKGHEPDVALRAGPEGLRYLRPILERAPAFLRAGGTLYAETASSTAERVGQLAEAEEQYDEARVLEDLEGHPRVLVARRG